MKTFFVLAVLVLVASVALAKDPPPPVFVKESPKTWAEYHGTAKVVRKVESEGVASYVSAVDPQKDCGKGGDPDAVRASARQGELCTTTSVGTTFSYAEQKQWGSGESVCWSDAPGSAESFRASRLETLSRQFSGEFGCAPVMPCGEVRRGYASVQRGCGTSFRNSYQIAAPCGNENGLYSYRGNGWNGNGGYSDTRGLGGIYSLGSASAFANASLHFNSYGGPENRAVVAYGVQNGRGFVQPYGAHQDPNRRPFGVKVGGGGPYVNDYYNRR